MLRTAALVSAAISAGACSYALSAHAAELGYAGQQSRPIKALSDADIEALRNGDGMGLAKPAELNGYPGPRHVLALTRELGLDNRQIAEVTAIRDRMTATAKPLGAELIERERVLDQLFAHGEIDPDRLRAGTAAIAELQGRLRTVHLAAHLETRSVLSAHQVIQYATLRGYASGAGSGHDHPSAHRH